VEGAYVPGETYLPDALVGQRYYDPSDQGLERSIAERLARLRQPGRVGEGRVGGPASGEHAASEQTGEVRADKRGEQAPNE
jgi:putative ATPase